jgi:hypothetical protein
MSATLRMIENQLATHVSDLTDLLQWMDDSCSKFLGWESVPVGLIPFRMVDDNDKKGMLLQLWQAGLQGMGPQTISTTTMAEINDIDVQKEYGRIKEETIQNARRSQELQQELNKLQNTVAQQVQQEAGAGAPQGYDQQQIIAQADQLASQFAQMDPSTRRSQLHQLQTEDLVMYSVVIQRLEQQQTVTKQQATVQQQQGGML